MSNCESDRLTVRADTANLSRIAEFVRCATAAWCRDEQESYDIQMAVDEACANIIAYAYAGVEDGMIDLEISCTPEACTITIRDRGVPFDPASVPPPDIEAPLEDRAIGGLGLYLMRRLMDKVEFEFSAEHGNTLRMVKRRLQSAGDATGAAP